MIDRAHGHIVLDQLPHLARLITRMKRDCPTRKIVVFKSDVARAFRNIPVALEWQIMQVITTRRADGSYVRNVDRAMEFGTRTSPRLYCGFHSLILWIAEHSRAILDLLS